MSEGTTDSWVDLGRSDQGLVVSLGSRRILASRGLKIAGLLGFVGAPAIFAGYLVDLVVLSIILSMFAMSVDMVWGYAGILTFGHAAFYGLGAYLMAILTTEISVSGVGYAGFVLGVAVPGGLGLLIAGVLFYRGIDEEYFTILTLALAIIANQVAISWASVTGGFNGIRNIPTLELGVPGLAMYPISGIPFYFAALAGLIVVFFVSLRIVRSPFGRALVAINSNEAKAASLGYDTAKYKTLVFGISAALAGFAGAFYATYSGFVSPPVLGFVLSTEVLIWVLVGGRKTLVGAIIGTTFLTLFENVISGALLFSWTLILGIVLILIVLVLPTGFVGFLQLLGGRLEHSLRGEEG
jgi:urea transport system permease protein